MLLVELVGQYCEALGRELAFGYVQRQLERLAGVADVGLVLDVEVILTEAIGGE